MTRATLREVLGPGHAVAGFVCLGWEDARAYVAAAEAEGAPVILQAGPGARAHMPVSVWGAMFRDLAEEASVPVVTHLDHGASYDDCAAGIAAGFSSVMFDGSKLPLEENIALTARIVAMAHDAGVSCEGEIGYVGYAEGAASQGTDPEEAARFAQETGIDAMAVSVGNVHLQKQAGDGLDEGRVAAIRGLSDTPLVIHGGSGVPAAQRRALALSGQVAKYNIGTEMRQAFGAALRAGLTEHPDRFDRVEILRATEAPLTEAARAVIRNLRP